MREKPNVIWIFGDQHSAQAVGYNGDPNVHTPNLDIMATDGANFGNAVAGFPLCCPFRGSLLSSLYPHECVPGHEYPMPTGTKTIVDALKPYGYETAYFGKWHLDGFKERGGRAAFHHVPKERRFGFDTWLGYENNNSQWDSWIHGHTLDGEEVPHEKLPGYETDCLTDILIDYLKNKKTEEDKEQPFFAVLSVQPPHNPYVAPEEFMRRHTPGGVTLRENVPNVDRIVKRARRELAGTYAMIENLDWNVGRVRKALDEIGLAKDTHIVFFSDHGDLHGSHGQFLKTSPYSESLSIPFLISGGERRYDFLNWTTDAPINHVDIAPTTLGLCGIETPDWMRGTDYSHHRLRKSASVQEPDSAFIQSVIPTMHGDSVDRAWRGVVMRDGWKWVALENQPFMLFNLNEDPYEQVNLAYNTAFREIRKKLNDRLAQWISDTGDSFQLPDV